jgi:hypothetical protein
MQWRYMVQHHGKKHGATLRLGGQSYDITRMSKSERKEASFDKEDPLDPRNPNNVLEMFQEP